MAFLRLTDNWNCGTRFDALPSIKGVAVVVMLLTQVRCEVLRAEENQFPYVVHVFSSKEGVACTASVIDLTTMLTTRDCVIRNNVIIADLRIVVKSLQVRGVESNFLTVDEVIPHLEQDLALIRVSKQLSVPRILLAHTDQFNKSCIACGYVRTCNVSTLKFKDGIGKGDYLDRSNTGYFFVYFPYYMLKRSFIGGALECEKRLLALAVGYNMDHSVIMFISTVFYNNWIIQHSNASFSVKLTGYVSAQSHTGVPSILFMVFVSSVFYLLSYSTY